MCIDLIEDLARKSGIYMIMRTLVVYSLKMIQLESLGYIHDYEDFNVVCMHRSH